MQPSGKSGVRWAMHRAFSLCLLSLALSGCDALPRDAAETTERIENSGVLRVAVLPGTADADAALDLLDRFANRHRARLAVSAPSGEHALHLLIEGEVDAVVGHFAKKSPWQGHVALSKPVAAPEPRDPHQPLLRIARRNGENALILATDRAIAELPQ